MEQELGREFEAIDSLISAIGEESEERQEIFRRMGELVEDTITKLESESQSRKVQSDETMKVLGDLIRVLGESLEKSDKAYAEYVELAKKANEQIQELNRMTHEQTAEYNRQISILNQRYARMG